jgi:twitching motility protein PilT
MEKLNEYLQALLSTCSYELHLEPNKQPYLVSTKGSTELANAPIFGTQISMMIFPLIPAEVKQQLPNQAEIEFVHTHNLGNFNFVVRKSPAGFNVTIRPMLTNAATEQTNEIDSANSSSPFAVQTQAKIESNSPIFASQPNSPANETLMNVSESVPAAQENNAEFPVNFISSPELETEQPISAKDFPSDVIPDKIEILPLNDPEITTIFSDDDGYERRENRYLSAADEFGAPPNEYNFSNETFQDDFQQAQFSQNQIFAEEISEPQTRFVQSPAQQFPSVETASSAVFEPERENPQAKARMDMLFHKMAEAGASDLHLSVSMPPMIRKDGKIQVLQCGETTMTPESLRELLTSIMPAKTREEFTRRNDSDFAYEIPNLARFRANVFMDRKGMGAVFRIIPSKMTTAEQLGLSPAILNLCDLSKGLVVVTGPTGSGKSTTLCAMINHINLNREDHIITIEDPIEFTHENHKCLVNQREVHNHTDSFKDALRAALREDPDILLVGEMRDLETISIAIETAETGHLVFGTLHTTTAASTVDRIIDQFPADRQQQIRVMLSESLKGVIAQTLLPKKGGGRVAALEVLIVTPAISNLIREGKTFQIPSAMHTGKQHGMVMLNEALFELVTKGLVEPRDAYIKAVDKPGFESMMQKQNIKI